MSSDEPQSQKHKDHGRLKKLVLRGAMVEAVGYGATNVIRLGSNLVLTRLLYPEAFGSIFALVMLHYLLVMLSDVGIVQSITQNERGGDDDYLDTAFTMQAIRGVILTAVQCSLAWPWAIWFQNDDLLWMVLLGSLANLARTTASTRVFVNIRNLNRVPVVTLELTSTIVGTTTTIVCAIMGLDVASLVIGMVTGQVFRTVYSHFMSGSDRRDRFRLHRDCQQEIFRFGRWIFVSSVLTIVIHKADQFVLGRLMGARGFGMYSLANTLNEVPSVLNERIVHQVVFPALSRANREQPHRLKLLYYRVRFYADAGIQVALGGLAGMADWVVAFLYEPRYSAAAWILQVLMARQMFSAVILTVERGLMAVGDPKHLVSRNIAGGAALLISMPVGYYTYGIPGLMWGTVLARVPALLVVLRAARKHDLLKVSREVLPVVFAASGFALGTGIAALLPDWTLDALLVEPLKAWWKTL